MPLQSELRAAVGSYGVRLAAALRRKIGAERRFLAQLTKSAALKRPDFMVNQLRQRVDDLVTSLGLHTTHNLALRRSRLGTFAGSWRRSAPSRPWPGAMPSAQMKRGVCCAVQSR